MRKHATEAVSAAPRTPVLRIPAESADYDDGPRPYARAVEASPGGRMAEVTYAGAESSVDGNQLDEALKRLLGREVGGILKSYLLRVAEKQSGSDSERVLHGVETLSPWLAGVLRRTASGAGGDETAGERTQRSTSARKEDK